MKKREAENDKQASKTAQRVLGILGFIVVLICFIHAVFNGDFGCDVCGEAFGNYGPHGVAISGQKEEWCDDCYEHVCRRCKGRDTWLDSGRCSICRNYCRGCSKYSEKLSDKGYCVACENVRKK